ncbi:MAG: hypothetical protein Q8L39_06995 [Burkholderiales bacterium]|nr:hypothetical protein [Burkholderiales bacterium]
MTEFDGKSRQHKAYITISCSGPEAPTTPRLGVFGTRHSRAGANLRFTTADCDWFYAHLIETNYDTGITEKHYRLVNPTREQLYTAISAAGEFLSEHLNTSEWDGGQITFIYAGHGCPGSGSWVFKDGEISATELVKMVAGAVEPNRRRCRIDLISDSCFAGAFFADLLSYSCGQMSDRLFLCDVFGAALSDEEAWEYETHGHGVFTYAFKAMFEPLMLGQPSLPRHKSTRIRDTDRLHSGGASWLTDDEQHAFEYTNGHLEVLGAGYVRFDNHEALTSEGIRKAMADALEAMPNVEVPIV